MQTVQLRYSTVRSPVTGPRGAAVRWPWPRVAQLCPGLLHLSQSTPLSPASARETSSVLPLQRGKRVFVFRGKGECALQARGELTDTQKSSPAVPDQSFLMRTSNPCTLMGPESTVLTGQWSCSNRSVIKLLEIQLRGSDWMGKVSVLLVEIQFWELL